MAAPMNTGTFAKALYPGVRKWFGKAYNEHAVEYTDLVSVMSSSRNYEEEVGLSGFGLVAVKEQGSSISYDSEKQGFTTRYTHTTYGLGFQVTREMMEDDLYDIVAERRARGLAFSARQSKEIVVANLYNRAFNSSYTGGDGKEMCATDHPNIAGGTYANELTTAADLSEASLEQACIDLMKFTNDRGLKISVMPQSLIIPVDLVFEAEKILKTSTEPFTANNTVNVVRGKFPGGLKVNHYLTDTDAWFIRTNVQDGPKMFQRRNPEFGVDNDFDTENAKYKFTERYSVGWTDPRAIFASPGA